MTIAAFLVMMTATTAAAPSVREPPPLPGTTAFPNSSADREYTMTVSTVDVYQHVLAVLTATSVSGGMGKRRSDLPCHHAVGLFSTDCQLAIARANEIWRRTDLMTEVLRRRSIHPPMVKSQQATAGTVPDVEGGSKVVEDNRLVLSSENSSLRDILWWLALRYKDLSDSNTPTTICFHFEPRENQSTI